MCNIYYIQEHEICYVYRLCAYFFKVCKIYFVYVSIRRGEDLRLCMAGEVNKDKINKSL
jgi:hypothetical protein